MQTIIINSQKGGSGKTMLSAHLSTQAEREGDGPVYLIDTDPQGTLTKWHSLRAAEAPQRVEVPFAAIGQGLAKLKQRGAAYCIVDTAPSRDEDVSSLFKAGRPCDCSRAAQSLGYLVSSRDVSVAQSRAYSIRLRHDADQAKRQHYSAISRPSLEIRRGCSYIRGRPDSVCRFHDGREDSAGATAQRASRAGNGGAMEEH
jgi:hypothetical protein